MKKIILSLIIGLFLTGCTASKNKNIVDAKVSKTKKTITSTTSNDVSSDASEEEGDDECMDEDE